MRLAVVSHKVCWPSERSPSGYATDGGFPIQMRALSELFDSTTVLVPCEARAREVGEMPLEGDALSVAPLSMPGGRGLARKLRLPLWLARNLGVMLRELRRADAVHAPIPGDVGTIGLLLALLMRKPLFVRYCGNWRVQRTLAERLWRWLLDRSAGGRTVVLATGGASAPPSPRNPRVRWIFSTSLTDEEIRSCGAATRRRAGEAPRLIIACRQEWAKGTGTVNESLPLLGGRFPEIRLDVVGDGGALEGFRSLAERIGVADRVVFHGRVDHAGVVALLQRADVFCFPTVSSEGFPKAVLEAMACGLPVVTTRVSVLPELLAGGGGVLLDEPTPAALADAVQRCLADDARYAEMSSAGRGTSRGFSL